MRTVCLILLLLVSPACFGETQYIGNVVSGEYIQRCNSMGYPYKDPNKGNLKKGYLYGNYAKELDYCLNAPIVSLFDYKTGKEITDIEKVNEIIDKLNEGK